MLTQARSTAGLRCPVLHAAQRHVLACELTDLLWHEACSAYYIKVATSQVRSQHSGRKWHLACLPFPLLSFSVLPLFPFDQLQEPRS
jgi:hypothetical protein